MIGLKKVQENQRHLISLDFILQVTVSDASDENIIAVIDYLILTQDSSSSMSLWASKQYDLVNQRLIISASKKELESAQEDVTKQINSLADNSSEKKKLMDSLIEIESNIKNIRLEGTK